MYVRRRIYMGQSEKIYQVVKNVMSITAERGRVLVFVTYIAWTRTEEHGIAASYAVELPEPDVRVLLAGVVETPLQPGAMGAVVCHGYVRSVAVAGFYGVGLLAPAWKNLLFRPYDYATTASSYGALSWTVSTGGAAGTYMKASLAMCAKCFAAMSYVGESAAPGVAWLPMYIRMV